MAKVIKKLEQVLEYELPLKVEALEEGGFLATSTKLQGVLAEGGTVSEAVANAADVAAKIIEVREEEGLPISLKLLARKQLSPIYKTTIHVQVQPA